MPILAFTSKYFLTPIKNTRFFWAFLFSLILCLSYLRSIPKGKMFEFFTSSHAEGVALSTMGKWDTKTFVGDAFTGEFPVVYNYLSDKIVNFFSDIFGMQPAHFIVSIYGPILTILFVLGAYFSFWLISGSKYVGILGCIFVSAASDGKFLDPLLLWLGCTDLHSLKLTLHTPVSALPLGTGQSLGWVLLLPSLSMLFLAHETKKLRWYVIAGILLGLLFQAHSLTFLYGFSVITLFLFLDSFSKTKVGISFLKILLLVTFFFCLSYFSKNFATAQFAILWLICLTLSITKKNDIFNITIYGLFAIAPSFPYLLNLYHLKDHLEIFSNLTSRSVPWEIFATYFLPFILSLGFVFQNKAINKNAFLFAATSLFISILLGFGHFFGFTNHEYRFQINAIFAFSFLSAIAFSKWTKSFIALAIQIIILIWIILGVLVNITNNSGLPKVQKSNYERFGSFPFYVSYTYYNKEQMQYFLSLKKHTEQLDKSGRILLGAEYSYPTGSKNISLALNFSQRPAYIPDYRYISWNDLYRQRINLICGFAPEFLQWDYHYGKKHCENTNLHALPLHGAVKLSIKKEELWTDVLGIYGISFITDFESDFGYHIRKRAHELNLMPVFENISGIIYKPFPTTERITFKQAKYQKPNFAVPIIAPKISQYTFILAQENISNIIKGIEIDSEKITPKLEFSDILIFDTPELKGQHTLTLLLKEDERYDTVLPSPLYFASGIEQNSFGDLFEIKP